MAVLVFNVNVRHIWTNSPDTPDRASLYALRNISTGDTIDMGPDFLVIKRAVLLGITVAGAVQAANAGNVITVPAGVTSDAAYLLCFGVHA